MIFTSQHSDATFTALERLVDAPAGSSDALRDMPQPYLRFDIPRGHNTRQIHAPCPTLKAWQRRLLHGALYRVPTPHDVHGFVPGRSIVSQATLHRRQRQLVNLDIADAFPSISRHRVRVALERSLGSFIKHLGPRADLPTRDALLDLIADLTTFEDRLPQGAPTSGAMLNFALIPLDVSIRRAVARWTADGARRLVYSRYADDITLSAAEALPPNAAATLKRAIIKQGLRFNPRKTHFADRKKGQPLIICGLHVDGDAIRLPRKTRRRYRALLHNALLMPTLDDTTHARLSGVAGLVTMVHGAWPPQLARPWRALVARHPQLALNASNHLTPSGYHTP